jgi:hypothetical protein
MYDDFFMFCLKVIFMFVEIFFILRGMFDHFLERFEFFIRNYP